MTIQNTDLLLVNRGGVNYQATWESIVSAGGVTEYNGALAIGAASISAIGIFNPSLTKKLVVPSIKNLTSLTAGTVAILDGAAWAKVVPTDSYPGFVSGSGGSLNAGTFQNLVFFGSYIRTGTSTTGTGMTITGNSLTTITNINWVGSNGSNGPLKINSTSLLTIDGLGLDYTDAGNNDVVITAPKLKTINNLNFAGAGANGNHSLSIPNAALSAASLSDMIIRLDGQIVNFSAGTISLNFSGGTSAKESQLTAAAKAALTSLRGKGNITVTLNT